MAFSPDGGGVAAVSRQDGMLWGSAERTSPPGKRALLEAAEATARRKLLAAYQSGPA
jgi:hypothetical protein